MIDGDLSRGIYVFQMLIKSLNKNDCSFDICLNVETNWENNNWNQFLFEMIFFLQLELFLSSSLLVLFWLWCWHMVMLNVIVDHVFCADLLCFSSAPAALRSAPPNNCWCSRIIFGVLKFTKKQFVTTSFRHNERCFAVETYSMINSKNRTNAKHENRFTTLLHDGTRRRQLYFE